MTYVTCRLAAKSRDKLRNLTLGNRVWATFTVLTLKVNLTSNLIRERTGVRGQMFGGGQKSSHSHCTATLWSSAGWTIDLRLFGTPIDGCQLIFGRVITGLWSYISDNKMAVSTPWNYWHIGISTNAYVLQSIGTVYRRLRYHSISSDLTKSICCSIGLYTPYRRSKFLFSRLSSLDFKLCVVSKKWTFWENLPDVLMPFL